MDSALTNTVTTRMTMMAWIPTAFPTAMDFRFPLIETTPGDHSAGSGGTEYSSRVRPGKAPTATCLRDTLLISMGLPHRRLQNADTYRPCRNDKRSWLREQAVRHRFPRVRRSRAAFPGHPDFEGA
jgi:hypothetical protein